MLTKREPRNSVWETLLDKKQSRKKNFTFIFLKMLFFERNEDDDDILSNEDEDDDNAYNMGDEGGRKKQCVW